MHLSNPLLKPPKPRATTISLGSEFPKLVFVHCVKKCRVISGRTYVLGEEYALQDQDLTSQRPLVASELLNTPWVMIVFQNRVTTNL